MMRSKRARSTFKILPFKGRIACTWRSRPCFAEPPAESPSTRKSSHLVGSRSWQSASLLGRLAMSIAPLRSEEHTSELQSLMRISYPVFCLKKKKPILLTCEDRKSTLTQHNHKTTICKPYSA